MNTIRLKEVLELIETAKQPFSIRYVACNRRKGTGGRIVHLERCFKTGSLPEPSKVAATSVSPPAQEEKQSSPKNTHHYDNYTRNLKVVPSGIIRKCSIGMIIQFNVRKVVV